MTYPTIMRKLQEKQPTQRLAGLASNTKIVCPKCRHEFDVTFVITSANVAVKFSSVDDSIINKKMSMPS